MRDLIASNAPLRTRKHKARPAYSQHKARGSNGDRSPLGTPFSSIFRRATKDGAPGGRKYANTVGKIEKTPAPSSRTFVPFNPHHYFANFWFKNPVSHN